MQINKGENFIPGMKMKNARCIYLRLGLVEQIALLISYVKISLFLKCIVDIKLHVFQYIIP